MEVLTKIGDMLLEACLLLWDKFIDIIPSIILAIVMLFVGLYLSRVVGSFTGKVLNSIKLDSATSKIGINELFTRVGFGKSPTYVVSFILSWMVMLIFIVVAADALKLDIIKDMLERFIKFVPNIVGSMAVLFAGLLFGKFVSGIVENSSKANNLKGGIILARAVNIGIVVFASLVALDLLNIDISFIKLVVVISLAALGGAFALGVGLASKSIIEEYLKDIFSKDK